EPMPFLNFAPLQNASEKLKKSSEEYQKAYADAFKNGKLTSDDMAKLNTILMYSERSLTRKEGLPGRPWFTHQIYAPGIYTGYAAKTLPSVREAVELKKYSVAEEQIRVVAETL